MEVVTNLLSDHSTEVQMDAVNLKVQWQGKKAVIGDETADKAGHRIRTISGGRLSSNKEEEGIGPGVKIIEEKEGGDEEEDETLETSRLLPASPAPSPGSQLTANESNIQSGNSVSGQTGKDKTKDENSSYPDDRGKNASKGKIDEGESSKPLLESTLQSPASQKPTNPHFSQASLPNVQISEEEDRAAGQPARHKSDQGFLSEDMLSLKGRNISETRTMSDDVETLSHVTESETAVGFDIANRVSLIILVLPLHLCVYAL